MVDVDWSLVSKSPQPPRRMKLKRLTAEPHVAIRVNAGTYFWHLGIENLGKALQSIRYRIAPRFIASRGLSFFFGVIEMLLIHGERIDFPELPLEVRARPSVFEQLTE